MNSNDLLLVAEVAGAVLALLIWLILVLFAGEHLTKRIKGLWGEIRGHKAEIASYIDDPSDPLVGLAARLSKTDPDKASATLMRAFAAFWSILDTAIYEDEPAAPKAEPEQANTGDFTETTAVGTGGIYYPDRPEA